MSEVMKINDEEMKEILSVMDKAAHSLYDNDKLSRLFPKGKFIMSPVTITVMREFEID